MIVTLKGTQVPNTVFGAMGSACAASQSMSSKGAWPFN